MNITENSKAAGSPVKEKLIYIGNKYLKPEIKQVFAGIPKALTVKPLFNFKNRLNIFYFLNVFALLIFGLAMQYSASYENKDQLIFALLGMGLMLAVSGVNVKSYREISSFFMVLSVGLLLLVLIFGTVHNGTKRWLWGFQPSELGKTAFIMFLAYLIDKYKSKSNQVSTFWVFIAIIGFVGVLIIAEKHLSGLILYLCIGYAMMWYGGMNKKWFAIVTVIVVFAAIIVVWKPNILTYVPGIKDYMVERIVTWKKVILNQELTYGEKIDEAHQVLQSLYGIGSGGVFGVGFGNSAQKVANLSEKSNDFIFAVIAEELGFVGAIILIALFGLLIWQGFKIAIKSKTYFGALVVMGISTQIALQVLINIAVATSLLPNTGISLPFFSSGGSSMLFTLFSMGVVLGISRDTNDNRIQRKDVENA